MYIKARWKWRGLKYQFYKKRAALRRRRRLYFPSPAELRFVSIMGGTYKKYAWPKDPRTGFCFARITSLGTILNNELVQREVRAGAMYIDFAVCTTYYKKGIEIDGRAWHQDVLREQQRDEYVRQYGFELLHIPAVDLTYKPQIVQRRVIDFLQK